MSKYKLFQTTNVSEMQDRQTEGRDCWGSNPGSSETSTSVDKTDKQHTVNNNGTPPGQDITFGISSFKTSAGNSESR
jgi:hypothetical protein